MSTRTALAAALLAGLLAACGGQGAPPAAPTATPPPAAPTATMAPVTEPTAAPTSPASSPLPGPVYALEEGQIIRVAPDGRTRDVLTDEQPFRPDALAIIEMAVSPSGDTLAYILQGDQGNSLILTDAAGQGRRALLEGVPVTAPRWSPDGSALAVAMWQQPGQDSPWQGGVWVVSATSGEARLLIANDPYSADLSSEAWGYAPISWSPDGARLLLSRYSLTVELGSAAVLDVASGELTLFAAPAGSAPGLQVQSADGRWAPDSSGVYAVLRAPALAPQEPGLYLADAASGALEAVVPARSPDGRLALLQAPFLGPDGALYALAALVERIPEVPDQPAEVGLYRVEPDGALSEARPERLQLFGQPIAAPSGAGLLIPAMAADGGVEYLYLPLSGEPLLLPIEPTGALAWGA